MTHPILTDVRVISKKYIS